MHSRAQARHTLRVVWCVDGAHTVGVCVCKHVRDGNDEGVGGLKVGFGWENYAYVCVCVMHENNSTDVRTMRTRTVAVRRAVPVYSMYTLCAHWAHYFTRIVVDARAFGGYREEGCTMCGK